MKIDFLTPEDYFDRTIELARKIREAGKEYDAIVSIVFGGVILGRNLADLLDIKVMVFIDPLGASLQQPGEAKEVEVKLELTPHQLGAIRGRRVLLVDDLVNSGDRMLVTKSLVERHCESVDTVAFYARDFSKIRPDFYLDQTDAWFVFPCELRKVTRYFREEGKSLEEIRGKIIPSEYFDRVRDLL
ncbi:MAG: phosphoribosyltransferase [Promethearchaeota archaeon]